MPLAAEAYSRRRRPSLVTSPNTSPGLQEVHPDLCRDECCAGLDEGRRGRPVVACSVRETACRSRRGGDSHRRRSTNDRTTRSVGAAADLERRPSGPPLPDRADLAISTAKARTGSIVRCTYTRSSPPTATSPSMSSRVELQQNRRSAKCSPTSRRLSRCSRLSRLLRRGSMEPAHPPPIHASSVPWRQRERLRIQPSAAAFVCGGRRVRCQVLGVPKVSCDGRSRVRAERGGKPQPQLCLTTKAGHSRLRPLRSRSRRH